MRTDTVVVYYGYGYSYGDGRDCDDSGDRER